MTISSYRQANQRYLRIYFPVMVLYVGLCITGPYLLMTTENPSTFLRATLAIITAAPIVSVFWLLGRYLKETDEYTRKTQADAMLAGGGFTLGIAVLWGFLELYKAAPKLDHFPALMMVGPLFFAAWGITYAVQSYKRTNEK